MSTHTDMIGEAAIPLLMEQFADADRVTYKPKHGVATSLSAIVGDERSEEQTTSTGRRRVVRRRLTITTDPSGDYGGVATPQLNATVTVDGISYAVESVAPVRNDVFDLQIVRYETTEVSRPDYRDLRRM